MDSIAGADAAAANDVLEITAVYGTQAVSIKNEEDLIVSIKKEESESDTEYGEYYSSDAITIATIQRDITPVPLVYTTRLDQMNAIHNIEKYTPKEATDMILAESKPQFKQLPVLIKPEPVSDHITSYIELCCQVQQLNTKVKTETYLRNKQLIKMCKPLKIVLEDFNNKKTIEPHNTILDYSVFDDSSSDEYVPLSHYSDNNDASKPMLYEQLTKSETFRITIVIKNKKSQDADIYILDTNKGAQTYYRTNIDEYAKIDKLQLSNKTVFLEYCCWVNREKSINKFINDGYMSASHSVYLRKPHNCLPRPCSCCCVFGSLMPKRAKNDKFTNIINNNTVSEVKVPINTNNNIIEKAKNYLPKSFSSVQKKISLVTIDAKPTNYLKNAVIIIKYHRVIFDQTKVRGENYEIGNNGEVINFVRPSVDRSISEEKQQYKMFDAMSGVTRTYLSYMICCWHSREDILCYQLRDFSRLNPSALTFLRTPHLCRNVKCECCCKPNPLISFTLENVATPKNTYEYYSYRKKQAKIPVTSENNNKKTPNTSRNRSETGIPNKNQKLKTKNSKIRTNKPLVPRKSKWTFPESHKVDSTTNTTQPFSSIKQTSASDNTDIITASDPCSQQSYVIKNAKTQNTEFVEVSNESNFNNSPVLSIEDLAATTTVPISILDLLKDLKLTVNKKGNLKAMINTRPGKLSNVEVKAISDILSIAATQINQLGITPHEFCNRVNSPKIANNSSSTLDNILAKDTLALDNDRSNLFTTTPQLTKIDSRGFKARQLNSFVPATKNISPVCSIYQMMSSLSGHKNQLLMHAYNSHFKEISNNTTPTSSAINRPLNNKPKRSVACAPVTKRRSKTKPIEKRLRVNSPELHLQTVPITPLQLRNPQRSYVPKPVKRTETKTAVLASNSNVTPFQKTSSTSVPQSGIDTINYNQIPYYVVDNNTIQQNTSVTNVPIGAIGSVHNQMHGIAHGNLNFVQNTDDTVGPALLGNQVLLINSDMSVTNTSSTTVPKPIDTINNQIPYFIINGNHITTQNKSSIIVTDPTKDTDQHKTKLFTNNSTVTSLGNGSNTIVRDTATQTGNNQIPRITNNGNVNSIKSVIDMIVPDIVMKAHNSKTLSSNSNVPMESTSDLDASTVALEATSSVNVVNPILHKMLTHTSSPRPYKRNAPRSRPPTISVKPMIQALGSKGPFKKQKRRPNVYNAQTNKLPVCKTQQIPDSSNTSKETNIEINLSSSDDEMNVEKSIKPNIIEVKKSVQYSEEEILHAVNNKQLIDDDAERCIFGV